MENLNTNPKFNTRPIGDWFSIDIDNNEVVLQVIPEINLKECDGCYFDGKGAKKCYEYRPYIGNCHFGLRGDKQGVIFKEIKPEPELNLCEYCTLENCEGCPLYDN